MVGKQVAKTIAFLLVVLTFVSVPQVNLAHAQNLSELSDEDRKSVADSLQSAQKHFEVKDYGKAIASLERAYGLFPEPNILYRIGTAYEKLSEFKVANLYFRRYLALRPHAKDSDGVRVHIKENETKIAAAEKVEVVRYDINVVTNPPGADVIFDGIPKGKSPLKINALKGRHLIELKKNDFIQASVFVNLSAKDENVSVQLKPFVEPYSAPVWPWVAIGVGGGAMVFSSIAFTIADSANQEVIAFDKDKTTSRPDERDAAFTESVIYERLGYGTLIGGGVLLGIGFYSLLLSPSRQSKSAFRLTGDGFAVKF